MHRCTQPKRKRFVIGNHAHKKEGRGTRYNAAQKGTATGDCLRGCCRAATFYQTSVRVLFVFTKLRLRPLSTEGTSQGTSPIKSSNESCGPAEISGCQIRRIQTRQPSCPGSSGFRSSRLWEIFATMTPGGSPRASSFSLTASMSDRPCPPSARWLPSCLPIQKGQIWESRGSAVCFSAWAAPLATICCFHRWDGQIRSPHGMTQKFQQAMAALKIKGLTLHSLRHTHASQLIASGMDVLTISCRLGHGSPAITLTAYGHLIEGKNRQAAEVMERNFALFRQNKNTARCQSGANSEVDAQKVQ